MSDEDATIARLLGFSAAFASIYVVGFTLGENSPTLAFLTILALAPLLYLIPVRFVEHQRRDEKAIHSPASPRLSAPSPTTPTAAPATDARS